MDRGYGPQYDADGNPVSNQPSRPGGCHRDYHVTRGGVLGFALVFLLLMCFVVPAYVWDHTPERQAYREQQKSETLRRTTARLREQAVSMLPPDATEVTVTRDDWPVGWLTFVRVEGGKSIKFLVCYRYDQATAEVSLSIARAD